MGFITITEVTAWSVVLVLLSQGMLTASDAGDVESARCRVRCLAHLKHKLGGPGGGDWRQNRVTFERCFSDQACTACVRPCGQPSIGSAHCVQLCRPNEEDCEQSCTFLRHLRTVRPGSCPPAQEVIAQSAVCTEACHHDRDCEGTRKCCPHNCGKACVNPEHLLNGKGQERQTIKGVPEIPLIIRVRERPSSGSVDITWLPSQSNNSIPILYMVQGRYSVGQHASELHVSEWSQLAQTTSTTAVLRDVGPGRWYEFRVAAVGINGTRGFSPPTKAFRLSKEPEAPGAPQNITEGQTVIRNNNIYLTVHWDPPKTYDLPINRYKIYWHKMIRNSDNTNSPAREHKKVIPGDVLSFELEELEPDTTYFIQVQAISAYGDNRLKSERTGIYITTYPVEQNTGSVVPTAILDIQSLVILPELRAVDVGKPYFHNGLLRTNITWELPEDHKEEDQVIMHWSADVCISDGTGMNSVAKAISATTGEAFFILYDLRFDCRYVVKLQPVSGNGQVGPVTNLSFQTPSCGNVKVIGDVTPDCPTHIPRLPEEPPNLQHSFLIMQTNITARISWQHPASDVPIIGYRVVWGQAAIADAEDLDAQPQIEQETSLTKVLSKDTTWFNLGNLEEATSYIVQVEAMSVEGSGKKAARHFTTPVLQPQHAGPPYKTERSESEEKEIKTEAATKAAALSPSTRGNWPIVNKAEESHGVSCASGSQSAFILIFTAVLSLLL